MIAARPAAKVRIVAVQPDLIVLGTALFVLQHLIASASSLNLLGVFFGAHVRVIFTRQPAVGRFDGFQIGVGLDAHRCVVIFKFHAVIPSMCWVVRQNSLSLSPDILLSSHSFFRYR